MSPNGLCTTCLEADKVILTFLFDPNLEPSPQNLHRGEANVLGGLRSNGMPLKGYADPVGERRTQIPLEHAR